MNEAETRERNYTKRTAVVRAAMSFLNTIDKDYRDEVAQRVGLPAHHRPEGMVDILLGALNKSFDGGAPVDFGSWKLAQRILLMAADYDRWGEGF